MAYVVFLLGLMLGGCGGYVLYLGFDDLTTERGLALTMSGTVAFSVGVAVLAIGFGILKLGSIGRKLDHLMRMASGAVGSAAMIPAPMAGEPFIAAEDATPMDDRRRVEGLPKSGARTASADDTMLGAVEDAIFAAAGTRSNERPVLSPVATPVSQAVEHPEPVTAEPSPRGRFSFGRGAPAVVAGAAGLYLAADHAAKAAEADGKGDEDRVPPASGDGEADEAAAHETATHETATHETATHETAIEPDGTAGPIGDDAPQSPPQSRLSDTHAEIDRLIEELAAENAGTLGVRPSLAIESAPIEVSAEDILPPEPDIYRMSAFEEAMMTELTVDARDEDAHAPERADETSAGAAQAPSSPPDRAAVDLVHLEPVKDETPVLGEPTTALDEDWIDPSTRHDTGSPAPPAPTNHEIAHLEPVAADYESSALREGTHQAIDHAATDHQANADEAGEVIGSYESAGVTYTLHADGSVIAEAGATRETYPSLEALRGAFERGESAFSV